MEGEDECGPYPRARYSSTATDRISVEDVSYKDYPNLASSEHFDFTDTENIGNVIRNPFLRQSLSLTMKGEDECGPYPRARYSSNTPRHKQYFLEQTRFKSFKEKNWPIGLTQTPEQLANAGFYYLGMFCITCSSSFVPKYSMLLIVRYI